MSYRYIGNKTRIVATIVDVIKQYVPAGKTVADPMCGTASVSLALKQAGYRVVASDLMTYATQHARVRLQLSGPPRFDKLGITYAELLARLNSLPPVKGLFHREYGPAGKPRAGCAPRKYLTPENAARVDAIRGQLAAWHDRLDPLEEALLRHDAVLAVNRVANIAGTYGHYRSTWAPGSLRPLTLTPTEFDPTGSTDHVVMQGAVELLAPEITADACYLDPPYMKRQYAANYHLLETIARGDEPEAIGVSGLRDWWDQYSNFCSKRKLADSFAATFEKMDCSLFFISYSEDGLFDKEQLMRLFAEFGDVDLLEFGNQRFRSNSGGAGGVVSEYLFVVQTGR
jgi:adenine-specific DNA-methyltransferase